MRVRSELLRVILKPNSGRRTGSHAGRGGVDNICPSWPRWGRPGRKQSPGYLIVIAWLLQVLGLVGFHTLQKRNYGRIGRGGSMRLSWGLNASSRLVTPLGRKRDTWRASNRRRGIGYIGRVGFVWCRYFASQGIAAMERHSAHRIPAGGDTLGELRGHILWTRLAGAGLHALVTQGSTI